jgi:hypothetical protein
MPFDVRDVAYSTTLANNTNEALVTLTAQAAGTVTFGPFYNPKVALRLAINITAVTGSLTTTILGYDNTSGATWTVLASTAIAAPGLTRLTVGPYITAVANSIAQDYAPVFYQVQCVIATGPVTATIGAHGVGQ